jgi:hypothetical protein
MNIPDYLRRISERLADESREIAADYSHPGIIGRSREDKVRVFLEKHLPHAFRLSRGFLVSADNVASPETDLLIADRLWGTPLHGDLDSPYWLIESTYASIEVKSDLSPSDISDCIEKCRRFKGLRRDWTNTQTLEISNSIFRIRPRIEDSLFIIWAFDGPTNQTIIDNLSSEFEKIPNLERPDLLLVNDRLCAFSGSLQLFLQVHDEYFRDRQQFVAQVVSIKDQPNIIAFECGSLALIVFLFWLTQWLQRAAPRSANIMNYMSGVEFGPVRFPSSFLPSDT